MRARQLSFLPPPETEYGGASARGRRKRRRPFDPKRPLHVTLRSSRARGPSSLLRPAHKWRTHALLEKTSKRYGIRIFRFANVGNHIHLLVQARNRAEFQGFLREFSGAVAVMMTGAVKGRPEKFWDGLAWSRIVDWGRNFRDTASYVLLNAMEGAGRRDRALLFRLEAEGIVVIGSEPGS